MITQTADLTTLRETTETALMEVSIIIVNWKSKDYVRECLRSLAGDSRRSRYEIFVVDNCSADGCGEMVHDEFPGVHFVQSQDNIGFARANNLALVQSVGRHILFLNPDTEICGDAIPRLSDALDALPDAGMVGARLLNSDLTLQTSCITALPCILNQTLNSQLLRRWFPGWRIWGMRPLLTNSEIPAPVEAISGACMMARREVVEAVGGFSTDYFMYSEDMDLCLKVAKTGHAIYYVPEAVIVHHAGGSSSQRRESNFSSVVQRESLVRFFELHRGAAYGLLYRLCTLLACSGRLAMLAVASPMALHPRGRDFLARAAGKWASVLVWSVGKHRWVTGRAASAH